MDKTIHKIDRREAVLPRTLFKKPSKHFFVGTDAQEEVWVVLGGNGKNVYVAEFFDSDEAEAFIQASNHFGQAVLGVVIGEEVKDGAGESGRGSTEVGVQG
jgi:hypothetical protein